MIDFELLKKQALKLCDEYTRGIFNIPVDLPYGVNEYFALSRLADIYYAVKTGSITRSEAIEEQRKILIEFNKNKA